MHPLRCLVCGRFLSVSGSTGHAVGGYAYWDECWGTCSVHGPQNWTE